MRLAMIGYSPTELRCGLETTVPISDARPNRTVFVALQQFPQHSCKEHHLFFNLKNPSKSVGENENEINVRVVRPRHLVTLALKCALSAYLLS